MTNERTVESLSRPVDRLRRLLDDLAPMLDTDLATPVPDCPGWTLRDLLAHLGRVYAAVCAVVENRATEPVPPGPEGTLDEALDDDAVRAWFDDRVRAVLSALEGVSPDQAVWTWSSERTAAFYRRRMVHETAVHAIDVARARSLPFDLDRDVCIDGIDEYFDVMLPRVSARPTTTSPSGSLHLHCTDGSGEWLVVPSVDGPIVTREHAKGAVAWRGSARSLLLAVWGRFESDLDVIGDQTVSDEWRALAP